MIVISFGQDFNLIWHHGKIISWLVINCKMVQCGFDLVLTSVWCRATFEVCGLGLVGDEELAQKVRFLISQRLFFLDFQTIRFTFKIF